MIRIAVIGLALMAGACTIDGPEPGSTSVIAELERQQAIEREQAERERLCRITKDEDPRKDELCRGVSGDQD